MKFMDKELKDIIVTLPFADGTEVECGVYAYFQVDEYEYFALLPFIEKGKLDFTQSYMLYRVEEDAEHNPVVVYIESDYEYAKAANHFSAKFLNSGK